MFIVFTVYQYIDIHFNMMAKVNILSMTILMVMLATTNF